MAVAQTVAVSIISHSATKRPKIFDSATCRPLSAPPPPGGPPLVIPVPPNIGEIAASQLIGALLNYCLYGVLAVQVYVYLYSIFFVETVMTALNGVDMYHWFSRRPLISPGGVMAFVVQLFFCYRIYIIKKEALVLCVFIALVSALQAAGGIGGGILLIASRQQHKQTNDITNAASTISLPFSAGLGLSSETDTYTGSSTYNGKVTVTTHSMVDTMRMEDYHNKQVALYD
ncbi:hypothetical protein R3P38DRAFT_2980505, partial [Favolaschia claudopus]